MTKYNLTCELNNDDDIGALKQSGYVLNLAVAFVDSNGNETYTTVAHTSDIKPTTVISWTDSYQIAATNADYTPGDTVTAKSTVLDIAFGQNYNFDSNGIGKVSNDQNAPYNGFKFTNPETASAIVYQHFGNTPVVVFVSKKLQPTSSGTMFAFPLKVAVWFEAQLSTGGVSDTPKFIIDFTYAFSHTASYDSSSGWILQDKQLQAESFTVGTILSITKEEGGFVASQLTEPGVPFGRVGLPPIQHVANRLSIKWNFGPVTVEGYVDTSSFEIGATISVAGIKIGTFFGNLKVGLVIKIDLFVAKGQIKFYLKNGKEVWVFLEVKIIFDGDYHTDAKILTL